ncbi:hypothetical protein HELRODRAFT_180732 [Helobdella robusta]|uniref:NAD-dependent epimerase/dehydratase domain-containing protein n=1 Tax=Helobdella robusta TaxID=6412 RepID=T1FG78_HELRO|nr:hypothetical protein HELRODRAFT_180732 [Helobdella robusta]ESN93641.1 hypothetical protein HELRODRAFT_180732 [Helobdella robusta]
MKVLIFMFLLYAVFEVECEGRNILVFGGNGFLGAKTVDKFLARHDNVTIVIRGNWYWDSKTKIKPFVKVILCDRKKYLSENCPEFVDFLKNKDFDKFDAVVDFSAYSDHEIKEALKLLKHQAKLYVYISTDSIYDVCDTPDSEPIKEESAIRPFDKDRRERLSEHHQYANKKFLAEEELMSKRKDHGIPYVILRLPDVVGPKDTTFRIWIYHLWIKLAQLLPEKPVTIPRFLKNVQNSFVYVEDVANVLEQLTSAKRSEEVLDQVYNLAWHENITTEFFLRTIEKHLGIKKQKFINDDDSATMYLYPTVRAGTLDSSKAVKYLSWNPTPFDDAIKATVDFYEDVMKGTTYEVQRDEIIQIQSAHLYSDDKEKFYQAVEKTYNINLNHFRPHDEL